MNSEPPHNSDAMTTHTYQREIPEDARVDDSLRLLFGTIPPGTTVLDVGTGAGALGRHLTERLGCSVDGITYNEDEAVVARPNYRDVFLVDLERQPMPAPLSDRLYDVIVCADVLEHLRNAHDVLAGFRRLLAPGGQILLSIPNVTHMGVLLGLLSGRFGRTHEGLLDSTHVHFFDRQSLSDLCTAAGYEVAHQDAVRRNLNNTEYSRLDFQSFPEAIRHYVETLPDADIYQFIWQLRPLDPVAGSAQRPSMTPPQLAPILAVPKFGIQLYVDRGGGFLENESSYAYGLQVPGMQSLKFSVLQGADIKSFRIDFGDRPGAFELDQIKVLDSNGEEIWSWRGDWTVRLRANECLLTGVQGADGGHIVRCTGDDPWLSLPLEESEWAAAFELQVIMSCPTAFADTVFLRADRMAADFSKALIRGENRLEQLLLQLREQAAMVQDLNLINKRLMDELLLARSQFAEVMSSSSWRLTAGLRAASRWIARMRS